MTITDLYGNVFEIDDPVLALMQADDYRNYRHSDKALEARQQAYWQDRYFKLLAIQKGAITDDSV